MRVSTAWTSNLARHRRRVRRPTTQRTWCVGLRRKRALTSVERPTTRHTSASHYAAHRGRIITLRGVSPVRELELSRCELGHRGEREAVPVHRQGTGRRDRAVPHGGSVLRGLAGEMDGGGSRNELRQQNRARARDIVKRSYGKSDRRRARESRDRGIEAKAAAGEPSLEAAGSGKSPGRAANTDAYGNRSAYLQAEVFITARCCRFSRCVRPTRCPAFRFPSSSFFTCSPAPGAAAGSACTPSSRGRGGRSRGCGGSSCAGERGAGGATLRRRQEGGLKFLRSAQRRVDQLEAEPKADPDELRRARGERNQAGQAHNDARRAACLAEQSRALNSTDGVPTGDLRTPSAYRPPATGRRATTQAGRPSSHWRTRCLWRTSTT